MEGLVELFFGPDRPVTILQSCFATDAVVFDYVEGLRGKHVLKLRRVAHRALVRGAGTLRDRITDRDDLHGSMVIVLTGVS